mmetsp:Transcript_30624/g.42670  ORF Transcript_30624/g.42670 Transcript_30624/m.42670 type:complete len:166 (+) Transcript_30624:92-589(+)
MIGLVDTTEGFIVFLLLLLLASVVASSFCLAVSAVSNNISQATFLCTVFFIVSMVFGGLFQSNETGGTLSGLRYFSFLNYAYEALCINEFKDLTIFFNPKGLPVVETSGDTVLSNFGMYPENFRRNVMAGLCFWGTFFLLGFAGLFVSARSPKRRRKRLCPFRTC